MTRVPTGRAHAVLLAAVAVAVLAPRAQAHALLDSSSPAEGATLDDAPDAVTLTFTEDPIPELSRVTVTDQDGRSLARGDPVAVPGDRRSLQIAVEPASGSVYTVTWRVVSRVDGHATAGALAFGVGVPPLDPRPPSQGRVPAAPSVSALEVAGRWALLLSLVLLLGAAVAGLFVFRDPPPTVRRLAAGALPVAALALIALALAQRSAAGVGVATFLGTSVGRALAWRGGAVLVAGVGIAAAGRGRWRRAGWAVAAAGAAAAMLAETASGHAAAAGSMPWAAIATQWAHFAAVGVWMGGLAALLVGIRGAPDQGRAAAVRRFSLAAGGALAVVAATGVVRAVGQVRSFANLFSTSYGQVVVAKTGLLLALAALGAVNRFRNVPRAGRSLTPLRRVSRAELTVAGVVIGATALLTSIAPPAPGPSARAASAAAPSVEVEGSDFATSVRVGLQVSPGLAGANRFLARVTDFDTGRPVEADVSLRLSYFDRTLPEATLRLAPVSAGTYGAVGTEMSLAGLWRADVLVQRPGDAVEVPLVIGTRCISEPIGGGSPTIYDIPFGEGGSVQGLVGGIGNGRYEVHFTFLGSDGDEIRIGEEAVITAWRPGEDVDVLPVGRLGPGHFVGDARLTPGAWRFQAAVSLEPPTVCFEETVD